MNRAAHTSLACDVGFLVAGLMAAAVVRWSQTQEADGRAGVCIQDLRDMHKALALYAADWEYFSGSSMGNWSPPPTLPHPAAQGMWQQPG